MDKDKIINIVENHKDKSNKDLLETRDILIKEYTKTKELIIDLTKHLDVIEDFYDIVNNEIKNRLL